MRRIGRARPSSRVARVAALVGAGAASGIRRSHADGRRRVELDRPAPTDTAAGAKTAPASSGEVTVDGPRRDARRCRSTARCDFATGGVHVRPTTSSDLGLPGRDERRASRSASVDGVDVHGPRRRSRLRRQGPTSMTGGKRLDQGATSARTGSAVAGCRRQGSATRTRRGVLDALRGAGDVREGRHRRRCDGVADDALPRHDRPAEGRRPELPTTCARRGAARACLRSTARSRSTSGSTATATPRHSTMSVDDRDGLAVAATDRRTRLRRRRLGGGAAASDSRPLGRARACSAAAVGSGADGDLTRAGPPVAWPRWQWSRCSRRSGGACCTSSTGSTATAPSGSRGRASASLDAIASLEADGHQALRVRRARPQGRPRRHGARARPRPPAGVPARAARRPARPGLLVRLAHRAVGVHARPRTTSGAPRARGGPHRPDRARGPPRPSGASASSTTASSASTRSCRAKQVDRASTRCRSAATATTTGTRLPFEDRKQLMAGHARVGRTYAGRVLQLITGSTGLDDWEWGVTLLADDPVALKEIVYEMRFDDGVGALRASSGPFFTGLVLEPADALERVGCCGATPCRSGLLRLVPRGARRPADDLRDRQAVRRRAEHPARRTSRRTRAG